MRFEDYDIEPTQHGNDYKNSLEMLEHHKNEIPAGWQTIYQQCLRRLKAIDCAERALLQLQRPDVDMGMLSISIVEHEESASDPVVRGILRKLTQQSMETCQCCSRRACWRVSGSGNPTLCSKCYVPNELASELDRWLSRMGREQLFARVYAIVKLSSFKPCLLALIPKEKVKSLESDCDDCVIKYVTASDLFSLQKEFTEMKSFLEEKKALALLD